MVFELFKVGDAAVFKNADFVEDSFLTDCGDFGEEIVGLLNVSIGVDTPGGDKGGEDATDDLAEGFGVLTKDELKDIVSEDERQDNDDEDYLPGLKNIESEETEN